MLVETIVKCSATCKRLADQIFYKHLSSISIKVVKFLAVYSAVIALLGKTLSLPKA